MDTIKQQIQALDNAEFANLMRWMYGDEQPRREAQPVVEQAKQEAEAETATKITQQLAEEHPELVEKPAEADSGEVREWEPWHPLRESTHYRYGDKTRHNSKVWRDVLDPTGQTLNVWEPGAPGIDERYWVEEAEQDEVVDTPTEGETSEDAPGTAEEGPKPWKPGKTYLAGQTVTHEGKTYRIIQGHTSEAGWAPTAVPALFQEV